jgi:hypothetical protein
MFVGKEQGMASAKTLYWVALGVLAAAFVWSHTGQRVMDRASVVADRIGARSSQYAALAEFVFGPTQSGYGRMQAATGRLAAQQARLQAEQARMQADMVREQVNQLLLEKQEWQGTGSMQVKQVLRDASVDRELVCPQTGLHIHLPEMMTPDVVTSEDPI